MADVAIAMARRGHRVQVYCANRGFENPKIKYAKRETLPAPSPTTPGEGRADAQSNPGAPAHNPKSKVETGVEIRRLPFSSFGKKSLLTRGLGTLSLLIQFLAIGLFKPKVEGILFSTSPPFIGLACAFISKLRGIPIIYWAMDLNPDQLLAMHKIKEHGFAHRILESINRIILRQSSLIIPLDRFMADRIARRGVPSSKMLILPPWPHEEHLDPASPPASAGESPSENPFRQHHNLANKFVIMYSGNHSPANPLSTLLQAAIHFKDDESLKFLFVGGGSGKAEVESTIASHNLKNAISLPYQPLSQLKQSLSAADIHVVSLGEDMVGIIHPCKIYGAMAVARPILFFGPSPSHVADLLAEHEIGWHVNHGNLAGAIEAINAARHATSEKLLSMGNTARQILNQRLSQELLCGQFCNAIEKSIKEKSP